MRWYMSDDIIVDLDQVEYISLYKGTPNATSVWEQAHASVTMRSGKGFTVYAKLNDFLLAFRTYRGLL